MALEYEVVTATRAGTQRARRYVSDDALGPGAILRLAGRDWLVERAEPVANAAKARLYAKPARYRLRLRHPDGREEAGAFRRFRPGSPRLGHSFTTIQHGLPISWQVVDERLASDEEGGPFVDLVAERDYSEVDALPDHELEHSLEAIEDLARDAAGAAIRQAEEAGLAVELVALEVGEAPDWDGAERYVDALILEEIEDDLLELCGVGPDVDARDTWLPTVKERLRSDLEQFRADIEGDHDAIEEWEFRDGRVFASVGGLDDESNPLSGHGWMCRLVDSSALGAAGFERVKKVQL